MGGIYVDFSVVNQLNSPALNSNTFANRPAAGQIGRLFISTDTFEIYRDNGTTWDLIGGPGSSTITGTGTPGTIPVFTGAQTIGDSIVSESGSALSINGNATATNYYVGIPTDLSRAFAARMNANGAALWLEEYGNTTASADIFMFKGRGDVTTPLNIQIGDNIGAWSTGGYVNGILNTTTNIFTTVTNIDTVNNNADADFIFQQKYNGTASTNLRLRASDGYVVAPNGGFETTGNIHLYAGANVRRLIIDANNGVARIMSFRTGNLQRWALRVDGNETGADTGANFQLRRYDDAGNFIDASLIVNRATGKKTFNATQNYVSGLATGNSMSFTLNVPNGTTFTSPNSISPLLASMVLNLAGNATIASGSRTGADFYNAVGFSGAGTLTMSQAGTIRALSNLKTGWAYNGSAIGTITHNSGINILFPDNSGQPINITNNYALLINRQDANTGTITYTNRWGIYQEGSADLNYLNGNLLIKSTIDNGNALQVTGAASVSGIIRSDSTNGFAIGSIAGYRRIQYDAANTNYGFLTDINTLADIEVQDIFCAGVLGVGINNNTIPLHVRRSAATEVDIARFQVINGGNNIFLDIGADEVTRFVSFDVSGSGSGAYVFRSGGAHRMSLLSNNNLLLGTQVDNGQRLQVNGTSSLNGNVQISEPSNITVNVPAGSASVVNTNGNNIISYQSSLPDPYNQNIQIDIVFNNWGSNSTVALVDTMIVTREFGGTPGFIYGKIFGRQTTQAATFSTFDISDITANQCTVTASSGGNYTLRITVDPTGLVDRFSIYLNINRGGASGIDNVTITYV